MPSLVGSEMCIRDRSTWGITIITIPFCFLQKPDFLDRKKLTMQSQPGQPQRVTINLQGAPGQPPGAPGYPPQSGYGPPPTNYDPYQTGYGRPPPATGFYPSGGAMPQGNYGGAPQGNMYPQAMMGQPVGMVNPGMPMMIGGGGDGMAPPPTSRTSQLTYCPQCMTNTYSLVIYEPGAGTFLVGSIIFVFGGYMGCCLIPCCIDDCKNASHRCPTCGHALGDIKFICQVFTDLELFSQYEFL
eukprot:TRINITY_DN4839_c0_g2_i1.p1 TRINITY_DN4839_c0_g2~~TRINITY_DN4839_c0_g2_i1.p1  ORF type:complete len:242 (+),score=19.60 TRINITY_DN4839_c0_g2_i1:51-776(+)